MRFLSALGLMCMLLVVGCKGKTTPAPASIPAIFKVDPATAGSIHGFVHFTGRHPARELVDMSSDPACKEAHAGKTLDESLIVGSKGAVANAFVHIDKGLEGKTFAVPVQPVVIDQRGCWFRPHVLGIQTGQVLQVVNSDPVTHNIHPQATVNREWNHSQGPGDTPLNRKFSKQEIMIRIKCNIHGWMHAFLGVVEHPYFAVTSDDGSFTIENVPPGTYSLAVWQEKLGTQSQQIVVAPHGTTEVDLVYKGN
jgi:hypothetical protein